MKKICSFVFVLLFSIGCFAIPTAAEELVIEIATAQQLSDIRNDLSGHYRLARDIIFAESDFAEGGAFYNGGAGWEPIGSSYTATKAFTGILDGNGYTISGLTISHTGTGSDAKFAGLFGHMNGTVRNLALDEVNITVQNTKSARVGAVAGQSQGSIENVSVDGQIHCLSGTNTTAVGGLVGRQTKTAVISGCLADVDMTVTGNTVRLGGIVGENEGGMVLACHTLGKLDGNATYTLYIGGIVGHNHSATSGSTVTTATVTNCLRDGETVGFAKSSLVGGGIVGWNETGAIDSCVTLQTIDFTGDTGVSAGQAIGDNDGGTCTTLYYVENDAEFGAVGSGDSVTATELPTDFTANDIDVLLKDDSFWSYQDGELTLNDLPLIPALRYQGVEYTVNADGKTVTIVGFSDAKLVTIPTTIRTYVVSAVGESVFVDQPVCYAGTASEWASVTVGDGNTSLDDAVCVGDLRFAGASLTLQNDLTVNYKVDASTLENQGVTDPYVVFEFNGRTTVVTDYTVIDGRYVFDFENIAPHQMTDTITATLYVSRDGIEYAGASCEYSVAMYCYTMLEEYSAEEYAQLRTLLVDLLVYGGKAQAYMDYDADYPVDGSLTDEQRAWGTASSPTPKSVTDVRYRVANDPTVQWKGVGLYLQNAVAMRFKFAADSVDGLSLKIKTDTGEWTIPSSAFETTDGGYTVLFDGLSAVEMSDAVYVTVCRGNIPVSHTLRYSIESYVYSQSVGDDVVLNELLAAMLNYGNAAKVYANNG